MTTWICELCREFKSEWSHKVKEHMYAEHQDEIAQFLDENMVKYDD